MWTFIVALIEAENFRDKGRQAEDVYLSTCSDLSGDAINNELLNQNSILAL